MKPLMSVCAWAACLTMAVSGAQRDSPLAVPRNAIGGDARVLAIKALRLEGTFRSTQVVHTDREGVTRVTDRESRLEIRILFPDHYLRIERDERFERRTGFAGSEPLDGMVSVAGGEAASHPGPDAIERHRATFTRLLAGLVGRTDSLPGLTAVSEGARIALEGPGGFAARLELDPATRQPARLVYRARVRVLQPGAVLRGARMGAGPSTAPEDDIAMTFSDRRTVGGVLLPHVIAASAQGVTLSEMRFEKVTVNPALTPADFRN